MPLVLVYGLLYFIIFFIGACIGSFLNVVCWRTAKGISFAKGRSHCPGCNHELSALDLIPFFSYIFLRGKCRYCKERISPRYPLMELACGLLFVHTVLVFDFKLHTLAVLLFISLLVCVTMTDFDTMEIPNGYIIALIIPAVASIFTDPDVKILSRVIGFFALSVPIFLLCLIIPGAFGGGDIKLLAAIGFFLGWKLLLCGMFIALIIGSVAGLCLKYAKKIKKKEHIPFGPYICIGMYISMFYGEKLIGAYLSLY